MDEDLGISPLDMIDIENAIRDITGISSSSNDSNNDHDNKQYDDNDNDNTNDDDTSATPLSITISHNNNNNSTNNNSTKKANNTNTNNTKKANKNTNNSSNSNNTKLSKSMSIQFINDRLEQSIKIMSIDMLNDAIRMAKDAKLDNSPSYVNAVNALEIEQRKRAILTAIEAELSKSTTVPKLLSRVDKFLALISQASSSGLGAEKAVCDTLTHLHSIQTLIQLRNRIRVAVEICSSSEMDRTMFEREKLLTIYGPDLCADEAEAVANMRRMIAFEKVTTLQKSDEVIEGDEEAEREKSESSEMSESSSERTDIKLPMFVCKQLELMRSCKSKSELDEETRNFAILVPNPVTRRGYVRAFKWVVAFAFWKFPRTNTSSDNVTVVAE